MSILQDELGIRYVKALIKHQSLESVRKFKISSEVLESGADRAFAACIGYLADYEEWPSEIAIFKSTGVQLPPGDVEHPDWLAELLRQRKLAKDISPWLGQVDNALENRDPDGALKVIREAAAQIKTATGTSAHSYSSASLARYEALVNPEIPSFEGIPSPWPTLNNICGGFCNGTLNVVTAMMNTGKTWMACLLANYFLEQGKNVLFVSLETPQNRIESRLDALRAKVPHWDILKKTLTTEQLERLRIAAERKTEADIFIADKQLVETVDDVYGLVEDLKPSIVLVDGGYRFRATGKNNWEATVSIVNALQLYAEESKIPWTVTTQQGEVETTKKGPHPMTVWNVKYGKEWSINPDVVIGLYQDEALRLIKQSEIQIMKVRDAFQEGGFPTFRINWNTEKMDYSEYVPEEASNDLITADQVSF